MTEFRIPSGRLYLSVVVDCFDGLPVGWSVSRRPDHLLTESSHEMACGRLSGERPVVHSDRGRHYSWPGWVAICREHGHVRSMSRRGHSPDNAACEGFFGRLKVEFFHGRDWSGWPLADFAGARRLHEVVRGGEGEDEVRLLDTRAQEGAGHRGLARGRSKKAAAPRARFPNTWNGMYAFT